MKLFNSPSGGQAAASLLTGDPTGAWYLTVGNPLNPIMMVGNLTCRETNVTFEGGLGVQDFPERMVVETGPAIKLPASMTFKPFNNKLSDIQF